MLDCLTMRRATMDDLDEVNRLLGRDFPGCDFAEALANPLNVCLIEDENQTVFAWRGPGIYETHVTYASRGRDALDTVHRAISYMRGEYGAKFFWSLIPVESRHVRLFARHVGWLSEGILHTQHGPCELFVSEKFICLSH